MRHTALFDSPLEALNGLQDLALRLLHVIEAVGLHTDMELTSHPLHIQVPEKVAALHVGKSFLYCVLVLQTINIIQCSVGCHSRQGWVEKRDQPSLKGSTYPEVKQQSRSSA